MKKHLSVLMLSARGSIYKVLAVLLLMTGTGAAAMAAVFAEYGASLTIEAIIERSCVGWIFASGLVLITAVLCLTGCEFGSRQGYTLRRLSVSEKHVFIWQCVYNAGCLFLLWTLQIAVVLIFGIWYAANCEAEIVSSQLLFLAFYRSKLLHSLLPLSDWPRWLRDFLLLSSLAVSAAWFPIKQRRGGWCKRIVVMLAVTIGFFTAEMGNTASDVFVIFLSLGVTAITLLSQLPEDDINTEEGKK